MRDRQVSEWGREGEMNRCTSVCAPSDLHALCQAATERQIQGCSSLLCLDKTSLPFLCRTKVLFLQHFCHVGQCRAQLDSNIFRADLLFLKEVSYLSFTVLHFFFPYYGMMAPRSGQENSYVWGKISRQEKSGCPLP